MSNEACDITESTHDYDSLGECRACRHRFDAMEAMKDAEDATQNKKESLSPSREPI